MFITVYTRGDGGQTDRSGTDIAGQTDGQDS